MDSKSAHELHMSIEGQIDYPESEEADRMLHEIRDNAGSRLKSKCRLLLMQIMVRYSG
jgi:hypothetical protein